MRKRVLSLLVVCVAMIGSSSAQNPFVVDGDYILRFCVSDDGSATAGDYVSGGRRMQVIADNGLESFAVGDECNLDDDNLLYNNAIYVDQDCVIHRDGNSIYRYEIDSKRDEKLFDVKDSDLSNIEFMTMNPNAKSLYIVSGSDVTIYNAKDGKILSTAKIEQGAIPINIYAADDYLVINYTPSDRNKVMFCKVTKDGDLMNLADELSSISDKGAYVVAPTDDENLWVFVNKEGLFQVDTSTEIISELVKTKGGEEKILELRVANKANKAYYKLSSDLKNINDIAL